MSGPWSIPVRLSDVQRAPVRLRPQTDAPSRARIAEAIGVDALNTLDAEVELRPWLDGVELTGRFDAVVTQTCGVTLEAFEQPLRGAFTLRAVPASSRAAPTGQDREIAIDPEADDPPDILEGEIIDAGAYLVEHMALEVDPFPRKPDAVFEARSAGDVISPFAALAALRPAKDAN